MEMLLIAARVVKDFFYTSGGLVVGEIPRPAEIDMTDTDAAKVIS